MIKGTKGQNLSLDGRQEIVFSAKQMRLVRKESLAVFYTSQQSGNRRILKKVGDTGRSRLKPAAGNRAHGRKDDGQASSSVPKVKHKTDVQSSNSRGASPDKRTRIPCVWGAKCNKSPCGYRHPPVCVCYMSEIGCSYGKRCQYRHFDAEEKHSKRSKKEGTQGVVTILIGCVSQDSYPKKSTPRKVGEMRLIERFGGTHLKIFSRALGTKLEFGNERAISWNNPKM